ncbi:MAG: hypothetical protein ACOYN2_02395 [Patescibacteria group bacterium]
MYISWKSHEAIGHVASQSFCHIEDSLWMEIEPESTRDEKKSPYPFPNARPSAIRFSFLELCVDVVEFFVVGECELDV